MPTPTLNSMLLNVNPAGNILTSTPTSTPSPVDDRLNALVATNTPPTGLAVSTAGPALKTVNQAKTTLATMQQGAAQQAQLNAQKQAQAQQQAADAAKAASTQKLAAALKPPAPVAPVVSPTGQTAPTGSQVPPTPPTAPTTGNPNADKLIGGINGVQAPTAPTNLTDAFGQPITAPPGFTQQDLTTYQQDLVQLQNGQSQAMQTIQTALGNIANGTYPLTPAQQSLLNATNQSFQIAQQYQQMANQGTIQAQISLGARLGQNKYNPTGLLSTLSNTYNQAALTMADISTKQAIAVGQLEQSFQKDDLDAINAQAGIIEKSFDEQSSTLNNLLSATQKYQTDMNNYNLSLAKDVSDAKQQTFQDAMSSANFNLSQAKDAFDSYIAQGDLTEKQKADAETRLHDRISEGISQAQLELSQEEKLNPLGIDQASPPTLKNFVAQGIFNQTSGGQTYLDVSQFSDPATKKQAEALARQAGVPIITNVAELTGLHSIDSGTNNLQLVLNAFQAVAPQNAGDRFFNEISKWASMGLDTPQGQAYQAYKGLVGAALPGIVKDVTGLNRVNTTEIDAATHSLPSTTVGSSDTWQDAVGKIKNLQSVLANNRNSLLDNKVVYSDLNDFVKNNPNPNGAIDYIDTKLQQNPTWTKDDVLQYIQYAQNKNNQAE